MADKARVNNWRVYWYGMKPQYIREIDYYLGIVTLEDGTEHEIAGMTPEHRRHWPHVHRIINRWIQDDYARDRARIGKPLPPRYL